MNIKNLFNWSDAKLHLIIIGLMAFIMAIYEPILGLIGGIILVYLIYHNVKSLGEKRLELTKYLEGLREEFDSATKHAIFNMPFPLVLTDEQGRITWYNTSFVEMMEREDILNINIGDLVPGLEVGDILKSGEKPLDIQYEEKYYKVYPNLVDMKRTVSSKDLIIMLYWIDDTKFVDLRKDYHDEKLIIGMAFVDNYDDVKNNTPEINRPLVLAEIDQRITAYFSKYGGIVRKYENDKHLIIMDKKSLEDIQSRKFDILDEIREINMGNTIPITLSMGVSSNGKNPVDSYEDARASMDIALGRGGNQVVLKLGSTFEFYGGKTKALEKRNKVKSRVMGDALRQLIDQSENIFVMGHKNPDMDSVGAAIGVLRGVKNRNKQGYLVLNGENPSIKNLFDRMKIDQPELLEEIITSEEAEEIISRDSLMIVVDNHKPSFTEAPELLELVDKIVVIDHHRRGAEFIKDPVLTYLEPYASSTCELVTEVLSYMSDNINLTKFEAEALMAGITVDTKNFSFQTGVRTFEAASLLKRAGADTTKVRQLFRDDFNTFIYKAEVIHGARIVFERIAIGKLETSMEDSILIAAQSANELLNVNGVEASFVLAYVDDKVHISGRSLGNISVQLILEKLGGGGHLTSAGVQLETTIDEAEELLINTIEEYFEEGDL